MILFGSPCHSMTETDLDALSNRHGLVLQVKLTRDYFLRHSPDFGARQHANSRKGFIISPVFP
ncbi:MAG: hypothetical protein ACD_75C01808G0008 [uncultured bacterium]|nr:MAG: hypothetical protein ACD_75C01808G0008 [uncultured bacterium]